MSCQGLCRRPSERQDQPGPNQLYLAGQPPAGVLDVAGRRAPVDAPLAAPFVFEPFDSVRDVDLPTRDPGRHGAAVEHLSGWPDEWPALTVLDVAGLLAHHHEGRCLRTFAQHQPAVARKLLRVFLGGAGVQVPKRHPRLDAGRRQPFPDPLRAQGRQGRGGLGHLADAGLGGGQQIRDMAGLGQVLPVLARHLGGHGLHLHPCGIEDVAEVRPPQVLRRILGQIGARRTLPERELTRLEHGGDLWRGDHPVHVGRSAAQKRAAVGSRLWCVGLENQRQAASGAIPPQIAEPGRRPSILCIQRRDVAFPSSNLATSGIGGIGRAGRGLSAAATA